ncbi:MAG: cold-shock protein [Mangrovibacterium sp.]
MGRSQETFQKKEIRNKKEKKRKEKEAKRIARKDGDKPNGLDDMIAWVDENGVIMDSPPDPAMRTEVNIEDIVISVPKAAEEAPEDKIRQGTVSYFTQSKGYGFIRDKQSGESVFVHVNNITEPIVEGNAVQFELERGPKGMMAVNVKVERQPKAE